MKWGGGRWPALRQYRHSPGKPSHRYIIHLWCYPSSELTAFLKTKIHCCWFPWEKRRKKKELPFFFVFSPICDECAFLFFSSVFFTLNVQTLSLVHTSKCIHWFLDRLGIPMALISRYCHLHLWLRQKRLRFFPNVLARTKGSSENSKACHTVATAQFPEGLFWSAVKVLYSEQKCNFD